MNNDQENITSSQKRVRLPEPDLANITVLVHNLPNKPILPWNRFDSPDLNKQQSEKFGLSLIPILIARLILSLFNQDTVNVTSHKNIFQSTEEAKQNQDGSEIVEKK